MMLFSNIEGSWDTFPREIRSSLRALEDEIFDRGRAVYENDMVEEYFNILATRSGH